MDALGASPMPIGGLEPPQPQPLEPKPSASTDSARWAWSRAIARRLRLLTLGGIPRLAGVAAPQNGVCCGLAMLATLAGFLALLLGLSLLLLPLLVTELSRPRDSAWGAVVLLLGLVLVTSAERLTGAPMLAVLCGGLLVGRLGGEVAQGRWCALSEEERQALRSSERWSRSLHQLAAVVANLVQSSLALVAAVSAWLAERRQGRSHGKRWVRQDSPEQPAASAAAAAPQAIAPEATEPGLEERPLESDGPADLPAPDDGPQDPSPISRQGSAGALEGRSPEDLSERSPTVPEATAPRPAGDPTSNAGPADAVPGDPGVRVVPDFDAIDALLAAAPETGDQPPAASAAPEATDAAPSAQP